MFDDLAAEFVAEHHVARGIHRPASAGAAGAFDKLLRVLRRVQIGAADAAAQRLHQHLAFARRRIGDCIDDDSRRCGRSRHAWHFPRLVAMLASIARISGRCSLPQNSSPSTTKLGTPNTPFASAARLMAATSSRPRLRLCGECRAIGARLRQNGGDDGDVLDIQLAPPEALEHRVVVAAEYRIARALRVQHAGGGECRIPDLLRAANHQSAFARLAATVHVAVAHAAPLMRVAVLLQHAAISIDARRSEKAWNVEHVGQPFQPHRKIALELVSEILRQIGVGALVVDIDRDACAWRAQSEMVRCFHRLVPQLVAIDIEYQIRILRHREPAAECQFAFELARSPTGVAERDETLSGAFDGDRCRASTSGLVVIATRPSISTVPGRW